MYIGAQKRTGPVELELVGEIPRTERLDTDIISPTSYDDVFEVIPTYRGARSKSELRLDMPEDLKARMCEVLRFCGVSEFDREDSGQQERSSRGLRSVRPLKTHSLGPPFLIRLMRYNILERKSPSYFDFGVNLTLPTSCLVSEHRLLRTVHPRDNPWYKGCRRLIVVGVPSSLLPGDIAEMFLSFSKKLSLNQKMWDCEAPTGELKSSSKQFFSLMELGIKRFTNLFTTENRDHYLNHGLIGVPRGGGGPQLVGGAECRPIPVLWERADRHSGPPGEEGVRGGDADRILSQKHSPPGLRRAECQGDPEKGLYGIGQDRAHSALPTGGLPAESRDHQEADCQSL
ncbi:hypothetical protein OIY81_2166 [Cryptosporidium canis]|uniref:Uncharacterized protein n=1 Tax=Cryptosporidium canis TaxID=195482 RepID=A0ABQ8PAB4_9CRYT|nr:hypothetical protein OIY81_2166 [Cryptosporidium canis]KAJ1614294.1 hypothetical protein OJ252_706 [Cryptosporidium canis]